MTINLRFNCIRSSNFQLCSIWQVDTERMGWNTGKFLYTLHGWIERKNKQTIFSEFSHSFHTLNHYRFLVLFFGILHVLEQFLLLFFWYKKKCGRDIENFFVYYSWIFHWTLMYTHSPPFGSRSLSWNAYIFRQSQHSYTERVPQNPNAELLQTSTHWLEGDFYRAEERQSDGVVNSISN